MALRVALDSGLAVCKSFGPGTCFQPLSVLAIIKCYVLVVITWLFLLLIATYDSSLARPEMVH
jgi:hypothetical protein